MVLNMVRFEIKKIFGSFGGKIALILYIGFLVLACQSAVKDSTGRGIYAINDQGQEITGIEAVKMIRSSRNEWEGILDEERIADVIQELRRIYVFEFLQLIQKCTQQNNEHMRQGNKPCLILIYHYSVSLSTLQILSALLRSQRMPESVAEGFWQVLPLHGVGCLCRGR